MLIIELIDPEPTSTVEHKALFDSIFERVQVANASAPTQARLLREYIMFANPNKPFMRTDKNTVKRKATVTDYQKEIEEFYQELNDEDSARFTTNINTTSPETTAQGVRDLLIDTLPSVEAIGLDDDLFYAGFNSLLALRVAKCLRSALEKYDVDGAKKSALTPKFIFTNPTINQLSTAFYNLLHQVTNGFDNPVETQIQKMKELRTKYAADLPDSSGRRRDKTSGDGSTVILTGSTGSLGSYLLESLIRQQNVNKVYCLNRVADGAKKQIEVGQSRGLTTTWHTQKVQFLQVDLSKSNFGLGQEKYSELVQQTTHIIRESLAL